MSKKARHDDDGFPLHADIANAGRQGYNAFGQPLSSVYIPHDPVNYYDDTPSLTVQEFAHDCDINNLMAQYERTGVLNHYNRGTPEYMDLSDVPDLRQALDQLEIAQTAFMRLPAAVRREFDNDAAKFVEFAQDRENLPQMRTWGLAEPLPPEPPIVRVRVENPDPAPPSVLDPKPIIAK